MYFLSQEFHDTSVIKWPLFNDQYSHISFSFFAKSYPVILVANVFLREDATKHLPHFIFTPLLRGELKQNRCFAARFYFRTLTILMHLSGHMTF